MKWIVDTSNQQIENTYTRLKISKRAAPSHRSETVVTGLTRLKVAKKAMNAATSFR
jgi:hypothetical protein